MTSNTRIHPDAPAGGGGPGFFRNPRTPGPIGAQIAPVPVVHVPESSADRMLLAASLAVPKLPAELRTQVAALLTRENMAMIAASTAILAASHAVGVGEVVDVILVGIAAGTLGWQAIDASRQFMTFCEVAKNANSAEDLERAADHFARVVTMVGVNTLLIFATRRAGALKPAAGVIAVEEAWWARFTQTLKFDVPENQGALWAGIPEERAKLLARNAGKKTMEMTLEKMGLRQFIDARLSRIADATFGTKRAMVWKPLSTKFAQSLRGKVTVYVDRAALEKNLAHEIPMESIKARTGTSDLRVSAPGDAYPEAWEALLMSELDELTEGLFDNPRVTAIELLDANTGKLWSTVDLAGGARAARFNQ